MTKRKPKSSSNSNKFIKTVTVAFSLLITLGLVAYKFLPEIKAVLLSESAKKEELQKTSDDKSNTELEKHFDVQAFNESSVSVITSNNSNVAVNSNNLINSNNVVNSNNKINQKTENNFSEGSKTFNNYGSSITQQPNFKPQSAPKSNQPPAQQLKTQQQPPSVARNYSLEDQNIRNYFALIESHRNRGVDLAKCKSVKLCLNLYNSWQNQANNLLSEIDGYLQQKYRKRSELQQKFGSETFNTQIFPDTKDSLESIQSIFFNRADLFGMMNSTLKSSFNSI
jgi:hypothetical protein